MIRSIAVWVLTGAALTAAPFSHKLHLELKLTCTGCHASAATSTKPEDNLFPDPKVCLPCHQSGREIAGPPATKVVHFSHQQHVKMGNLAPVIAAAIDKGQYLQPPGDTRRHLNGSNLCEACHRGLEESTQVSAANLPRMADCLVCHNKIENPFSCEQCHEKGSNLKPANHVEGFMSAHSSGTLKLDKSSCAVCHGKEFHCLGCH